jgi:hypothetical protein
LVQQGDTCSSAVDREEEDRSSNVQSSCRGYSFFGEENNEFDGSNKVAGMHPSGKTEAKVVVDSSAFQNKQELVHEVEDSYCRRHYHIRESGPQLLEAAMLRTSYSEQFPAGGGHLVIVGRSLQNLHDLVRPLRAVHLGSPKHIVILHPEELPVDVWDCVSMFEHIYVVRGSPLEESSLRRAGIFKAAKLLFLCNKLTRDESILSQTIQDAEAIFIHQLVRRMNPAAGILLEIVHHRNVSFLDYHASEFRETDQLMESEIDFRFSESFASGTIFTSSLLDSFLCQVCDRLCFHCMYF